MDDECTGLVKEFQDVFSDIENNEGEISPEQQEREKRLTKKQQIPEQMQSEQELDRRIRGLQMQKQKKQRRSESTKVTKRISLSGNPNGGSESEGEPDTNMNKRRVHSEGGSQPGKKNRSEKSGGARAYNSPSNRDVFRRQEQQDLEYEAEYNSRKGKTEKSGKKGYREDKGKSKGGKTKGKRQRQKSRILLPIT